MIETKSKATMLVVLCLYLVVTLYSYIYTTLNADHTTTCTKNGYNLMMNTTLSIKKTCDKTIGGIESFVLKTTVIDRL